MSDDVQEERKMDDSYSIIILVKSNKPGARKVFKEITVTWFLEEGWPELREKIRPHLNDGIEDLKVDLDDSSTILVKPATRRSQKAYEPLQAEDFPAQMKRIWKNIQKNGRMPAEWQYEIIIQGQVSVLSITSNAHESNLRDLEDNIVIEDDPTPARIDSISRLSEYENDYIILPVQFIGPVQIMLPRKRLLRELGLTEEVLFNLRRTPPQ
jgi:hypothetical protein